MNSKILANKKGFTLVELMIVVAIIGILAAIAIPNFIRFQARSKQAEAKTNLKAIFTGEKSRFAESDRYAVTTGAIGFTPERGNRYAYDLGANAAAGGSCAAGDAEDRAAAIAVPGAAGCGVQPDTFRYPAITDATTRANLTGEGVVATAITGTGVVVIAAPTSLTVGGDLAACPLCSFVAAARGNIDNELGTDAFLVSSEFMTVTVDACADQQDNQNPGTPVNVRNDVGCDL
jgi:type IV pilus assembly protein PilA